MRKTKIVCTIGPASSSKEMLTELARAGMDVARLNFSHGSHEEHETRIATIRDLSGALGRPIGIIQDLPGPKFRLGAVRAGSVALEHDQEFVFTARPVAGDAREITLPHPELISQAKRGATIFVDDAKLQFRVVSNDGTDVLTRVVSGGALASHKGVTIPGSSLTGPAVTERDLEDLRFGLARGVDWVAQSFVRSAADVRPLREEMARVGVHVPVIAKIERPEAVKNIVGILEAYDGIMVARGDLGIELPIYEVPVVQKALIKRANQVGKPVVTATQMLDSMMHSPRPTRAEASDVANAIYDGSDAIMLSGETAVGEYPVQAVQTMALIAVRAERALHTAYSRHVCSQKYAESVTDAIGEAAAALANDLRVAAIITCTATGTTARTVSKYRPRPQIVAAASKPETARQLTLSWGIRSVEVPMQKDTDSLISEAISAAKAAKLVRAGNKVVVIAGVPVGVPGNTSLIKVETVS